MDRNLEIEIIEQFIVPSKQERLIGFVSKEKTRDKFIKEINSPAIFDSRWITEFEGNARGPDMPDNFKSLGMSGRVYVVSENSDWDGQRFQMSYIVNQCVGMGFDAIGYCWKTRTAFYEWHHSGTTYFMNRK